MSKKTLVILLLALLLVSLLFAGSLGLAGRKPGAGGMQIDMQGPGSERISGWLSRPVGAGQLTPQVGSTAGCRLENEQIIIRPGQTCVFLVPADKVWARKLRLALHNPHSGGGGAQSVTVSLEQPNALKVEQTLLPGKTAVPLDIYGNSDQPAARLEFRAHGFALQDTGEYGIQIVEK